MIEIVKPEKAYDPEYGDVLFSGAVYLEPMTKEKPAGKKLRLEVAAMYPNVMRGLKRLDISPDIFEQSRYECAATGFRTYRVLPLCVVHPDVSTLFADVVKKNMGWASDYILDVDWHERTARPGEDAWSPSSYAELLLGSGYDDFCGWNDGSPGLKFTTMGLSNGAKLWVAFWEWYNK